MSEEKAGVDLARRLRAGDADAAAEFVRRYEPIIRSRVRVWLRGQDARLRRLFDSMDICQSVLASFFVRVSLGHYDLEDPNRLVGLLVRMARHKLTDQVERHQALRRDVRRTREKQPTPAELAVSNLDPSERCAGQELLQLFRQGLSAEEQLIADYRAEGRDWAAIALELGGTPDGRRMQLARALDRVASRLGLS